MRFSLILAFLCICCGTGSAVAQPAGPNMGNDGWRVGVGAGVLLSPTYVGDDDYRLSLLPNIQVQHGDRFFASVQNGIGYNVINNEHFRAGPISRIRFGRDENGGQPFAITGEATTDLIGLREVSTTAELGGFVEYKSHGFRAGFEARKGVNGHNGFVLDASLRYGGRSFVFGPPLIYSIGPRVKIVDSNYHSAYFDIDTAQSLASGLPNFDADGGLNSYGLGATVILPLSRDNSLSAVFIAGYDRLAGDAANAPLIQQRGSEDQGTVGVFFSYWFQ